MGGISFRHTGSDDIFEFDGSIWANINNVKHARNFSSIQAAINALPSTGGTVFLDAGTYTVSDTITLKSNVSIIGEGNSSIVHSTINDSNKDIFDSDGTSSAKTGIRLANFKITSDRNERNAIFLDVTSNSIVENLYIEATGTNAIMFYNPLSSNPINDSNIVRNNFIDLNDTGSRGIYIDGYHTNTLVEGNVVIDGILSGIELDDISGSPAVFCTRTSVVNNRVTGCFRYGILAEGSQDTTIIGNCLEDNGSSGFAQIGVVAASNATYNAIVSGNTLNSTPSSTPGIKVSNSELISIISNIMDTGAGDGINCTSSTDLVISNNLIRDYSGKNIYIQAPTGSTDRILVSSNNIDAGTDGVYIINDSDDVLIVGNLINNCSTAGVNIANSSVNSAQVLNNKIINCGTAIIDSGTTTIKGSTGSFTSADAKTITVTNGFVTGIV